MAHSKSEIKKAKNLLNKYAPKGEQLAFINSKEANLLKSKGGSGKMTKAGIRSYVEYGTDDSDTMSQASSTGSVSGDSDRGGGNDYSDSPTPKPTPQPASFRSINPDRTPAPKSILSRIGDYIKGGGLVGMGLTYLKNQYAKDKAKREANVELGLGGQDTIASLTGGNNGGDSNTPAFNVGGKIIKLSPTTAEISQSGAADADAYDNRKTKAKGRSMMIQTSSRGINRNNTLTLGKPSLLGA